MTRPRNNFAIPKGDRALYGVLTVQDLRDMRPDLGPLNSRIGRFLRRFTLPVSTGSGASRQLFIKIPLSIFERAPLAMKDALRPFMQNSEGRWLTMDEIKESHSWLIETDAEGRLVNWSSENNEALDNELGKELNSDESPFSWEEP